MSLEHYPIKIARNLQTDAAFFAWVARSKDRIGRILYMSSSAAYPLSLQQEESHSPLSEHMIEETRAADVDGIYGWCKLTGENLARKTAERIGVSVGCARLFSGYGPDQDLNYPVAALAARAATLSDPLLVWGSGKQCRDFIYISDCIAGMRRVIERISDGSVVNLGTGIGTSLAEVARTLAKIAGYQPQLSMDLTKPVGAGVRVADIQEMRKRLNWSPNTSIEDGLRKVVEMATAAS
jgi:GDP-L-fucose synthase